MNRPDGVRDPVGADFDRVSVIDLESGLRPRLEDKRLAAEILEARRAEWMNQVRHDGTDRHPPRLRRIVTAFTKDRAQEETEFVRGRHIRRTLPKRADELVVFKDAAEDLSVSHVQAKNHQAPPAENVRQAFSLSMAS